jgi:hypothetical protein
MLASTAAGRNPRIRSARFCCPTQNNPHLFNNSPHLLLLLNNNNNNNNRM